MDNIYSITYKALNLLGYDVKEEGSYGRPENLSDTYITYFIVDNPTYAAYDNLFKSSQPRIQLKLYSRKPSIKQNADELFKSVMIPAGFMRVGGRDLPFNSDTGHYCYICDYRYYLES